MIVRTFVCHAMVASLILSLFSILAVAKEREFAGETIYVAMIYEPREEALKKMTSEFEKKTGIKVVVDLLGFEDLVTKTLASSQAKTGEYDIMQLNYMELPFYGSSGWLYDLTSWVRRDAIEVRPDDFHHVLYPTHIKYRDKWYGMPMHVNSEVLFYRKDIFDEMGFDAPKNWDDTILKAKAINEKYAGKLYGITFMGAPDAQLGIEFHSLLASQGGDFYDKNTYEPLIDTPEGAKAMSILQNLVKYAPPGVSGYALDANYNAFAQGQAAMCVAWTTGVFFFGDPKQSKIVDKWEVMSLPGGYSILGGWSIVISEYSEHKGAAWEWIKWATSYDMERKLLGNMESPRLSILLDPKVQKDWPNNRVFLETLEKSPTIMPQVKVAIELWQKSAIAANEVEIGITKPKEALKRLQKEFTDIMTQAGYLKK